jgi:hypothetical protein
VLRSAQEESTAANIVDLAGHALGVIVDATDETVAKDLVLTTSDAEAVLDVTGGLLEVEGAEMITDSDALVESLVGSEAQLLGQVGLAEQDEGEQGGGVHLVVEQEAELVEEVVREQVSLVDDEESKATLAGEVRESSAELGEETGEAEGRLGLKGKQDLMIESRGGQVRIGEVNDGVEVVVERVDKGAESGGFASTNVASDESGETLLEGEREAALGLAVTARGVKVLAGDGSGERGAFEAIEIIESGHRFRSPWG